MWVEENDSPRAIVSAEGIQGFVQYTRSGVWQACSTTLYNTMAPAVFARLDSEAVKFARRLQRKRRTQRQQQRPQGDDVGDFIDFAGKVVDLATRIGPLL
jgi:hypothetical protein